MAGENAVEVFYSQLLQIDLENDAVVLFFSLGGCVKYNMSEV